MVYFAGKPGQNFLFIDTGYDYSFEYKYVDGKLAGKNGFTAMV